MMSAHARRTTSFHRETRHISACRSRDLSELSAAIKLTLKGSSYELVLFEALVYLKPSINFCSALLPGQSCS